MSENFLNGPDQQRVPITEQGVVDALEIESAVRRIEEKYEGEERIRRLVDFVVLSTMEVILIKDPKPVRLSQIGPNTQAILKKLAPGAIAADESRQN